MQDHREFECLELMKDGGRQEGRTHLDETKPTVIASKVIELENEKGGNLMMRKIIVAVQKGG